MLEQALIIAVVETALAGYAMIVHRRKPFESGAFYAYRFGVACAALSLLCMTAAVLVAVPQSRGVAVVIALAALAALAVRGLRGKQSGRSDVHAETQQAAAPQARTDISSYRVRTVAQVQPHGSVLAPDAQRSARVRRIQSMGESYGD